MLAQHITNHFLFLEFIGLRSVPSFRLKLSFGLQGVEEVLFWGTVVHKICDLNWIKMEDCMRS